MSEIVEGIDKFSFENTYNFKDFAFQRPKIAIFAISNGICAVSVCTLVSAPKLIFISSSTLVLKVFIPIWNGGAPVLSR